MKINSFLKKIIAITFLGTLAIYAQISDRSSTLFLPGLVLRILPAFSTPLVEKEACPSSTLANAEQLALLA